MLLACGPLTFALAVNGSPFYIGMALLNVLFFFSLKHISTSLQTIFVRALIAREREAALANQFDTALNNMPHGLAVSRRRPPGGHESPLQQDDEPVGRFRAARRRRIGHLRGLRRSRNDVGGELQPHSAGSRPVPRQRHNHDRSGLQQEPVAVLDVPADGRRRHRHAGGGHHRAQGCGSPISHLARYDDLTELPNRVNFRDEIGHLLAAQQGTEQLSALLFIDLDQFKQVNDTLGHPCGDQLLCAVAGRLREMLRPEDFVARFGGDEFVVFQQNIHSADDAAGLARRIVDRLSERYKIDNHLVEIGASVGIAMTSRGVSADTLLKNADMALYRAKADGRGTFCFFRDEMAQVVESRRILELDLRKALANEEFELFFQPLVNLKSGRISTCEALLRWNHPVRGTVSPTDIIPVAEDMGLIVDLGRWIFRKACMECMKWPEGVSVAVNFSPQQFHQRDVLSEVRYASRSPACRRTGSRSKSPILAAA